MIKNKALLACAAIFFSLCLCKASFALESSKVKNVYPDYGYEFNGRDTCERFNRKLFIFNLKMNKYLIRPVNIVWASVMPKYGMDRIQCAYKNINYPVRVTSCLLQKDFKGSKQETIRFLTNTTLGFAGLYDPAKTKFKIEPRQEDMQQVLAYYHIKKGPYLVLPVVRGNIRDLAGQALNCPFNPCSYVLGPFAVLASAAFFINNTTYMQPLVKRIDDTYADPYEITKQIDGIERYIKNNNLDRKEVLKEKTASQNIINISNVSEVPNLKADVNLNNFNPQTPLIDSMRTAIFDNQKLDYSIWSEMSLWNKAFNKRLKSASVCIDKTRPRYKYRYILRQTSKTTPLAILYPSIGDGINSDKSTVLAKILYDEGYSVIIQGSAFNWEFVKSMPKSYRPGLPYQDAKYLRMLTDKIINDVQVKHGYKFDNRILVGCSFGGLTALFVAAQEENQNVLGISKYITINPPIQIFFALKQLDKYSQDWKYDKSDIKMRAAITAEKVLETAQKMSDENYKNKPDQFNFTDDEAKLVVGFVMKQKLSDVVFAVENGSRSKKNECYNYVNNMSFYDYAQKYLFVNQNKPVEQFDYDSSLYSMANFLHESKKYKIYHSLDDYFVNLEQLVWLKDQAKDKAVYFSNGSHMGFLYRQEFLDQFKKDISLKGTPMIKTKPEEPKVIEEKKLIDIKHEAPVPDKT